MSVLPGSGIKRVDAIEEKQQTSTSFGQFHSSGDRGDLDWRAACMLIRFGSRRGISITHTLSGGAAQMHV